MYETKRLILRNWTEKDIPKFINMNQDPRVMEFFPELYSPEETIKSIHYFKQSIDQHGYGMFACELKENSQFIGFVGLMRRDIGFPFSPCVEIGWRLQYEYWGQGFALEAARKCLDLGYNKFNLNEIVSFTASINTRSEQIMQKLGMQRDVRYDFYHPKLDHTHPLAPCALYRLSRDDFMYNNSPNILFITGASGAGKTSLLNAIQHDLGQSNISYFCFDTIGVPPEEEMIEEYGSGREWQKAMTYLWVNKIINECNSQTLAIIEGQVDLQFIIDAFNKVSFSKYEIILVHADRMIRDKRLKEERNQPNLANDDMESWATYLKNQAKQLGKYILDTTNNSKEASAILIVKYLKKNKLLPF